MSEQNEIRNECCPVEIPCQVEATSLTPLSDEPSIPNVLPANARPIIKVPVVLAETTIQVVVEANIPLNPPASEIKRVFKDVFLTQCKLIPVRFGTDLCHGEVSTVTRAKLFIEGYIRKDIEYATEDCNGVLRDRIATVPFSGFVDLENFLVPPILGDSSESRSRFIHPQKSDSPRLDKYFFENRVYYNEQPYCELVSANFFELDFSPCPTDADETFSTLREKIVVDLTLKVLQDRQVRIQSLGNP
ncbi:CsxC family protein [Bacillus sp. FJAT-22090]|uniref:CsxC family protein n=1 Tax=Bacillus sp. FJAT-22090 TaxID=1581038 RepID=UPI0011A23E5F|nr:Uracil permease [Bacillus sp. FJAT-22090]